MLAPRELDVLALIARGYTTIEIACTLGSSTRVVERSKSRIRQELHALSMSHAVAIAYEGGLLPASELRAERLARKTELKPDR